MQYKQYYPYSDNVYCLDDTFPCEANNCIIGYRRLFAPSYTAYLAAYCHSHGFYMEAENYHVRRYMWQWRERNHNAKHHPNLVLLENNMYFGDSSVAEKDLVNCPFCSLKFVDNDTVGQHLK